MIAYGGPIQSGNRFSRGAACVVCFVLLMPPLALLAALLMETAAPNFTELPFFMPPGMGLENPLALFISLTTLIIFYAAFGMQALACGLVAAFAGRFNAVSSLVAVLLAAAIAFAMAYAGLWRELPETLPTMLLLHVVPAVICWLICRTLWTVNP